AADPPATDAEPDAEDAAAPPPNPPGRRTRNAAMSATAAIPAQVNGRLSNEPPDPRVAEPAPTRAPRTRPAAPADPPATAASYARRRAPSVSQWRATFSRLRRAVAPGRSRAAAVRRRWSSAAIASTISWCVASGRTP